MGVAVAQRTQRRQGSVEYRRGPGRQTPLDAALETLTTQRNVRLLAWHAVLALVYTSRHARRSLGAALAGVFIGLGALRWGSDLRLLGVRTTLANIAPMVRVRYRAPLLRKGLPSPHAVGLHDAVMLGPYGLLLAALRPSPRSWLAASLGPAAWIAFRSENVRTPTVLYLGASTAPNFRLCKLIQANGPEHVLSAIDHADPKVMLGRPLLDTARTPYMGWYEYPQSTTLRTSPGEWERTVQELIELAPLVVLDLQIPSAHVRQELAWIAGGSAYKTILVASDHVPIDAACFCAVATDVEACLGHLCRLTASRAALPTPSPEGKRFDPSPYVDALVERRRRLRSVYDDLFAGGSPSDREIRRLFGGATADGDEPLTASLDGVLALVGEWSRPVSLVVHVDLEGRAACEVWCPINDAFIITPSGPDAELSPPRALLATLVATELLLSGEAADDPILTAPRPRVTYRERRQPSGREDLAIDAVALERDVRESSAPVEEIDDRLHALFEIVPGPETRHTSTSVDAAFAFALAAGLSPSIYVDHDGVGWSAIGGTEEGRFWRWQNERAMLPPAAALVVEMLGLFAD